MHHRCQQTHKGVSFVCAPTTCTHPSFFLNYFFFSNPFSFIFQKAPFVAHCFLPSHLVSVWCLATSLLHAFRFVVPLWRAHQSNSLLHLRLSICAAHACFTTATETHILVTIRWGWATIGHPYLRVTPRGALFSGVPCSSNAYRWHLLVHSTTAKYLCVLWFVFFQLCVSLQETAVIFYLYMRLFTL